jgi:cardiolipin synthase
LLSVPNVLSFARLLAGAGDGAAAAQSRLRSRPSRCFVLAGISDAVDGWWAKTFNARTEFGAYLDPLADKRWWCRPT